MNVPRVSVVIPTFNRARLVGLTIDSVLAQTFRDFEIIVVDDGSTDDTAALLAGFGERVRVLRQPNQGMNPARNAGLAAARGEYVALLDSDDLWEPYKLALQVELLDRFPDAGFVFSEFSVMESDEHGAIGPRRAQGLRSWHAVRHDWSKIYPRTFTATELALREPDFNFNVYEGCVYERSLYQPMVLPSTTLIRGAALARHALQLPVNVETHGDWEFFARLSRLAGALFTDVETTINRSHEDAVRLTRADPRRRLARRIAMIDRVWRADAEFNARRETDINAVQRQLLVRLARMHLLESDAPAARAALRRASELAGGLRSAADWATLCLAHLPGGGQSLRALRRLISGRG